MSKDGKDLLKISLVLEEMAKNTLTLCCNVVKMQEKKKEKENVLEGLEAAKHRVVHCKMHAAKIILVLVRNGTELIKAWLENKSGDAGKQARHEAAIEKYTENKREVKKAIVDVKSSMDDLRMAIGKSTAALGLSLANILQNSFEADKAYEATRQIAFRLTTAAAAAKEALMKKK